MKRKTKQVHSQEKVMNESCSLLLIAHLRKSKKKYVCVHKRLVQTFNEFIYDVLTI